MNFGKFMIANILGAAAWVGSLVTLGYFLGRVWPDAEKNLGYIIVALILITAIPVVKTYLANRQKGGSASTDQVDE